MDERLFKHLNYGVYKATDTFRAIQEHACVCFDDMTLVAVTGRAEDELSQKYAEMFADAPKMLVTIAEQKTRIEELESALRRLHSIAMTNEPIVTEYAATFVGGEYMAALEKARQLLEVK